MVSLLVMCVQIDQAKALWHRRSMLGLGWHGSDGLMAKSKRARRLGGMPDWALEFQFRQKPKKRNKTAPRKNIPTAIRKVAVQAQIEECLKLGLSQIETEERVIAWNSSQAAPLKIGDIKQYVYFAFKLGDDENQK